MKSDVGDVHCGLPGAHLQDVLVQGLGMSFASLPKACVDYVSSLVDNAAVLAVQDTSLCRYARWLG